MCPKERWWSESGAPGDIGRVSASPWFHRLSIVGPWWFPKAVVKVARVKIWPVMWFGGRLEGSKSMTVDPWIQDHFIMTIDANWLKSMLGRACEAAPMDWWRGQCQGCTWGPGRCRSRADWWAQVVPWLPTTSTCLHVSIFVTFLLILAQISYIQINLHVQVEICEL
jgi:hypothetical protein